MVETKSEELKASKRIFLSYAHEDTRDLACKLYCDLTELGHDVWIDRKKIEDAKSWEEQIEQAILESEVLIALLSPCAVQRPDGVCLDEISMARYNSKRIIPVMVLNVRPPLGIYRLNWVDFQEWQISDTRYQKSFERLLKAIDQPEDGGGNIWPWKLKPLDFGAELSRLSCDFTGRAWLTKDLEKWLIGEDVEEQRRVFFVIGDPGTGKSAFLAHLINKHPQVAAYHFCKSNFKDSRDPFLFICSIAAQLSTQLEDYRASLDEVELDNIEMREPYDLLRRLIIDPMRNKQLKQPLLIIVDALDEAYDYGPWNIPKLLSEGLNDLNPQVRFVVSSRRVPAITDRFSQYNFHEIDVAMEENRRDIEDYLNQKFSENALNEVMTKSGVNPHTIVNVILNKSEGNFLYVTQAVAALKSGKINPKKPETFPTGLVGFYLKDFEHIFPNGQGYDQIKRILEIILAAREPLTARQIAKFLHIDKSDVEKELERVASYFPEREMEKIAADASMNTENVKERVYQAFHKSIAEWLTGEVGRSSNYRIDVGQGQRMLAKACWEEYQQGIANMSSYALAHLPIHLLENERFDDLAILLKDPKFFVKSWTNNEFDIKACWAAIERRSNLRIMDIYQPVFVSPRQYPHEFIFNLSEFLTDTGHIYESISLLEYLAVYYIDTENELKLQSALCDLAWALYLKNDFKEAKELLKMAERISKNINFKQGLQRSFGYLANIYTDQRDYNLALELYHEQQRICREIDDNYWLQISIGNEGSLHRSIGDNIRAMELYKEKESICRRIGNLQGLQWSFNYQANICVDKAYLFSWDEIPGSDNDRFIDFLKQNFGIDWVKAAIINKIDNGTTISVSSQKNSLSFRLNDEKTKINLTIDDGRTDDLVAKTENGRLNIYNKKKLDQAMNLYQQQQRLAEDIVYTRGLLDSLERQIFIYGKKNELDRVNALSKELERISKGIGEKKNFQRSLDNQAIFNKAMNQYKEKEMSSKSAGNLDDAQRYIGNQAMIFEARGELFEAVELYQEQEKICRKIGNEKELRNSLRNQWEVRYRKGELDLAMELYNKNRHIFAESWNKHEIKKFLGDLGSFYYNNGNLQLSFEFYQEQEELIRKNGNKNDLQQSLANQGLIHEALGKFDQALALYISQEQICKETGNLEHLTWSLANQGDIYRKKGELNKAMEIYKKQEQYSRNIDNKYWLNAALGNQGDVHNDRGELDSALELYQKQEMVCLEIGDFQRLQKSLCNQGDVYYKKGELEKSLDLYKKEEEICKMVGNSDDLQRCIGYQAQILESQGEINKAALLYKERDLICSEIDIKKWLQISLGDQDTIHEIRKEMEKHFEMFEVHKQICQEFKNITEILKIDHNQAIFHDNRGEMEDLMMLNKKKEQICRYSGFKMGLQHSLSNQGIIHYMKNELDEAMELFKSQEKICREIGYKEGIQISLGRQADILYAKNELEQVFEFYTKQEQICLELENKEDFQICLGKKANIYYYYEKGDLTKALELYKEQEKICQQIGYLYWLQKAVGGQGLIHMKRNEFDQAMELFKKQEQICRSLGDLNILALSLINQANLLIQMNKISEALITSKEAFQLLGNQKM